MDLYCETEFSDNIQFLIVDRLIHGCASKKCKYKLMAKGKDVSVKECLEIMPQFEAVDVTMRKLEDSSETRVDASHTLDPTKKSQRNGCKETGSKRSDGKRICFWCMKDPHPRDKCPAKDAICKFCKKQRHFERACLKKNAQSKEKNFKSQHPVEVTADQDSSGYEDEYDVNAVSTHAIANGKSCEVFAPVVFNPNDGLKSATKIMEKVDTGAMVSCIPMSMIAQIGLSKKDLTPSNAIIRVWYRFT